MDFNSTTVIKETFKFDPTEYYQHVSHEFSKYHQDPTNVGLHFVTTPLAMIGAFSILHTYTSSSSMAMSLVFFYLLSLLPTLPNGVFAGTVILCGIILACSRQLKLGFSQAKGVWKCQHMHFPRSVASTCSLRHCLLGCAKEIVAARCLQLELASHVQVRVLGVGWVF